jgi:hypothetical protein
MGEAHHVPNAEKLVDCSVQRDGVLRFEQNDHISGGLAAKKRSNSKSGEAA